MSQAVQATLQAVGTLNDLGQSATPFSVARHMNMSQGTIRRYIATGQACGFLEKAGGGGRHPHTYRLTESGKANRENLLERKIDSEWEPPTVPGTSMPEGALE